MWDLTEDALNDYARLFVMAIKAQLRKRAYPFGNPVKGVGNKVASGNLIDSINYSIVQTSKGPIIQLEYADYFQYVNRGRKPNVKRVPINVLLKWISIRGIKGRDKKGRFIKKLSLAYAIQTNIFKYGIRPANIYDRALDSLEDLFENPPTELQGVLNELYDAIGNDINNLIEQTIEKAV